MSDPRDSCTTPATNRGDASWSYPDEPRQAPPYRAELANEINKAGDMRRRGLKGLARNWLDLAHRSQHAAGYFQPIDGHTLRRTESARQMAERWQRAIP